MNKSIFMIVVILALFLVVSGLNGCPREEVEKDVEEIEGGWEIRGWQPGPPEEVQFELKGWKLIRRDNDAPAIELTYSTNKPVEVELYNPEGEEEEISTRTLSEKETKNFVPMRSTAYGGKYKLSVTYPTCVTKRRTTTEGIESVTKCDDYNISEHIFTFLGPRVSIENVSVKWEYLEDYDSYITEKIDLNLINNGDLPADVELLFFTLYEGKESSWCFQNVRWVWPGEKTLIIEPKGGTTCPPAWKKQGTFDLRFRAISGEEGKTLAEYSEQVPVP